MVITNSMRLNENLNRSFNFDGRVFVPTKRSKLENRLSYPNIHAYHVILDYLNKNHLYVYAPEAEGDKKESTKLVAVSTSRFNEPLRQQVILDFSRAYHERRPIFIPQQDDQLEFDVAHLEVTSSNAPSYMRDNARQTPYLSQDALALLKPRKMYAGRLARLFESYLPIQIKFTDSEKVGIYDPMNKVEDKVEPLRVMATVSPSAPELPELKLKQD